MKALHVIFLVFALILGANASQKPRQINRQVLENRLRVFLKSGFRDAFEDNLTKFIDTCVRNVIINGSTELDIPVCDPLAIDNFDIDINQDSLKLQGVVDNVDIWGASAFKVGNVTANLTTLKAEINVTFDEGVVYGEHYNLTGEILDGQLEVFGEGYVFAEMFPITLKFAFELGEKADGIVEVRTLELNATIGYAQVNFQNMMGGGTLGDITNDYVSSELPILVKANKIPLLTDIANALKEKANKLLVNTTRDELVDLINNQSCN